MNKFNKVDPAKSASYWGPVFPQEFQSAVQPQIDIYRMMILKVSMLKGLATQIITDMDPEKPWYRPIDFVKALAAMVKLYADEVKRKSHVQGKRLNVLLWSATAHDRMQWYFNGIRARHSIPTQYLPLLGSGTSAAESLNHEINSWFENMPQIYAATLKLELHMNMVMKLMTHNTAMYKPQLRQLSQQCLAAASHSNDRFTVDGWETWCNNGYTDLPLHIARSQQRPLILAHEAAVLKRPAGMRKVSKRPASSTCVVPRRACTVKRIKRHPFNLKRVKHVHAKHR
jgi:hypothetical protein